MTPDIIRQCQTLISSYAAEPNPDKQNEIKGALYLCLRPHIIKWMNAVVVSKQLFGIKDEVVSLSWDCFEFCLSHYKPQRMVPVPNHFYAYVKFFLGIYQAEQNRKNNKTHNQFVDSERNSVVNEEAAYLIMDELKAFHASLDNRYKDIFEDAVMSMSNNRKDRVRRVNEGSYQYTQYIESKKVFKMIIDFLLRR